MDGFRVYQALATRSVLFENCVECPLPSGETHTMRDIDQVIDIVKAKHPTLSVQQLKVSHPGADDDGLWFFRKSDGKVEIQIESSNGMCPFLVETTQNAARLTTNSVDETVEAIVRLLHSHNG